MRVREPKMCSTGTAWLSCPLLSYSVITPYDSHNAMTIRFIEDLSYVIDIPFFSSYFPLFSILTIHIYIFMTYLI